MVILILDVVKGKDGNMRTCDFLSSNVGRCSFSVDVLLLLRILLKHIFKRLHTVWLAVDPKYTCV